MSRSRTFRHHPLTFQHCVLSVENKISKSNRKVGPIDGVFMLVLAYCRYIMNAIFVTNVLKLNFSASSLGLSVFVVFENKISMLNGKFSRIDGTLISCRAPSEYVMEGNLCNKYQELGLFCVTLWPFDFVFYRVTD